MILPPSLEEIAAVLAKFEQHSTVRHVKAKGSEADEGELREWQREVKRRSRSRHRPE